MMGHTLGAAGGLEAIVCAHVVKTGCVCALPRVVCARAVKRWSPVFEPMRFEAIACVHAVKAGRVRVYVVSDSHSMIDCNAAFPEP